MNHIHTPGPWYLRLSDNATPYILHGDSCADLNEPEYLVCVMPAEIAHSYNSFANAKLIAAAPALFDALQNALAALESVSGEMTVGDRFTNAGQDAIDALIPARRAIAQALGTQ